jgi:hypothetical protein
MSTSGERTEPTLVRYIVVLISGKHISLLSKTQIASIIFLKNWMNQEDNKNIFNWN